MVLDKVAVWEGVPVSEGLVLPDGEVDDEEEREAVPAVGVIRFDSEDDRAPESVSRLLLDDCEEDADGPLSVRWQ